MLSATRRPDVWVLTSVPLPIPIDRTLRSADLAPSPVDLMLAASGIAFFSPKDAAKAYPELWETPKAAEHDLARANNYSQTRTYSSYTGLGVVSVWSYRRAAARGPAATALIDERRHADPAAALTAVLGRLTMATRVVPRRASPVERATSPGELLNAILGTALVGRDRPRTPWEEHCLGS